MEITLISFLGKGNYQKTNYELEGFGSYYTHLLPVAICKLLKPKLPQLSELILLVTKESRLARNKESDKTYIDEIKESLKDICKIRIQEIPSGNEQKEFWQIFEVIAETLQSEKEVIIDITHSFRYLPLFITSALNYIRITNNIRINRIVYGAFEAKDKEKNVTPIYDLTPFLELQDWIIGTKFFLSTANGELLSKIFSEIQRRLWKEKERYRPNELPRSLMTVGSLLDKFSQTIWLAQPLETMKVASKLSKALQNAKQEIELWAKPFNVILLRLKELIEMFAYDKPRELTRENLETQRNILNFLFEKKLYMQTYSLAREWLISYTIFKSGMSESWLNIDVREKIAQRLSNEGYDLDDLIVSDDLITRIQPVWNKISQIRNVVSHCGMRKNRIDVSRILKNIKEGIKFLNELPI